ncbi:hypothetical protein C7T86_02445 [Xanthomonas citri pv. malvacearum]|uniref:Uncharacterized protein n=1 Tax=Xanthomonas campestris pv. malvacearum TaxID=86040 RepID=A0AA45BXF2_XANCM|nr:hypothetical protein C7T86_02445 [Xanthomonas citri pv. malvacearum]
MRRVPRRWAGKGLAAKYQIDRSIADPSKKVVHQLLRLAVPPPAMVGGQGAPLQQRRRPHDQQRSD